MGALRPKANALSLTFLQFHADILAEKIKKI